MSHVQIIIDKLVLRGIAPGDRGHLVAALETELSRALSDPEMNLSTRANRVPSQRAPVLRLGKIAFTPGPAGSRSLGRYVGRNIAREIGRRTQP